MRKNQTLRNLNNLSLESLVAAFYMLDKDYIQRDLKLNHPLREDPVKSMDILQADIITTTLTINKSISRVIECKSGATPNDLILFIGKMTFLEINDGVFVCNNTVNIQTLKSLGTNPSIITKALDDLFIETDNKLIKHNVFKLFIILEIEKNLTNNINYIRKILNRNLTQIEDEAFKKIKKYYSILKIKIWNMSTPYERAISIQKILFKDNRDFIRKIARTLELRNKGNTSAILLYDHLLCRSASTVVFLAKLDYLFYTIQCAVDFHNGGIPLSNDTVEKQNFNNCLVQISDSLNLAIKIPKIIQNWLYYLGGILNIRNEYRILATLSNESEENVFEALNFAKVLLSILFNGNTRDWSILQKGNFLEFNNIPLEFRGFGIYFRQSKGIPITDFVYSNQWLSKFYEAYRFTINNFET